MPQTFCWSTFCGSSNTSSILSDFVVANGLEKFVTFPTHSGGNILDLVLSVSPDIVQNVSSFSSSLLCSDHFPISFDLDVNVSCSPKSLYSWVYAYSRTDFEGLNSFLQDYDFSALYGSDDVESAWVSAKRAILTAVSLFTPLVRLKSSRLPYWFTPAIRHELHCVHSLRKR